MEEKMKKIKAWLDAGYRVRLFGNYGTYGDRIVKSADGNYYHYSRFGSSAVQSTEDGLNFVLTKIFNSNDDFYIINSENHMECTNDEKAIYCNNTMNTFLFSENPEFIYGEALPDRTIYTTITDIILNHYDYGKFMRSDAGRRGGVHFAVKRLYTNHCGEFKNFTFAL